MGLLAASFSGIPSGGSVSRQPLLSTLNNSQGSCRIHKPVAQQDHACECLQVRLQPLKPACSGAQTFTAYYEQLAQILLLLPDTQLWSLYMLTNTPLHHQNTLMLAVNTYSCIPQASVMHGKGRSSPCSSPNHTLQLQGARTMPAWRSANLDLNLYHQT